MPRLPVLVSLGGRLIARLLSIAVLVVACRPAAADVTPAELAEIAKQALEDGSVLYDPPRVSIRDKTLDYSPGKIFYPNYAAKPAKPYGFPLDVEFRTALVRKFRADQKEELAFLEPYLTKMEAIAAEQLALIAKHQGTPQALLQQLAKRDDQTREIFKQGVQEWAKKQGLGVAKESFPAAVIPTVKIQTVPVGGTVYYLNAVEYHLYKSAGVLGELDRWNQVPGKQMDMGGTFYFRAAWSGGKTKQTAKITIDKDQTISLKAD